MSYFIVCFNPGQWLLILPTQIWCVTLHSCRNLITTPFYALSHTIYTIPEAWYNAPREVMYMARRIGSGGRPPLGSPPTDKCTQLNLTIPGNLKERLEKFCEADERSKSWAVQKALDQWLTERGYWSEARILVECPGILLFLCLPHPVTICRFAWMQSKR